MLLNIVTGKAGDSVAIYNLGILYLNGRGVPRNLQTAEQLFTLAGQQDMYRATYILGQMKEAKKIGLRQLTHTHNAVPLNTSHNVKLDIAFFL